MGIKNNNAKNNAGVTVVIIGMTNSINIQESDTAQTQTSSTTEQSTSKKNGIVNENGERYYYINGVLQKGQQNINGSWYLFNRTTGVMMYGQQKDINGQWYLFDRSSGIMRKDRSMMLGIGISLIVQVG